MPFGIPSQDIVDAEVVSETVNVAPKNPHIDYIGAAASASDPTQAGQLVSVSQAQLALYDRQARAVSVFIKIPFFAVIACTDKVPGIFRLTAVALGIFEAIELARDSHVADQFLPPLPTDGS